MEPFNYNDMRRAYSEMYLREGTELEENRMAAMTAGQSDAKKSMKSKPAKVTGGKAYTMKGKDGKPLFGEENESDYSELELVGDFLIENGFVSDAESIDAFYAHMSDEWKSQILEKADDNGNTSCWDTHKKVGMKKKGGKMVNNCVPK